VHVLKIDVPQSATPRTPWRLTRQSPHPFYEPAIANPSLDSRRSDVVLRKRLCAADSPDTDSYAVAVDAVVSVTPLSLDLTSRTGFDALAGWLHGR